MNEDRINYLVDQFNGLIKYAPMLQDHPKWSYEECLLFAKRWHKVAVERYKKDPSTWNSGIPYCRNIYKPELA